MTSCEAGGASIAYGWCRSLACVALCLSVLIACATTPLLLQIPTESHVIAPSATSAPTSAATSAATGSSEDSITVQVRYFSHSPTVTVVAWRTHDPRYGLRTQLRTDGSLLREHVVYLSASYHAGMPQSLRATIPSGPLRTHKGYRDADACRFGACSPEVTVGALLPDQVLRSTSEALPVTFYDGAAVRRGPSRLAPPDWPGGPRDITLVIDRGLVAAFLAAVDSVGGELRRTPSTHSTDLSPQTCSETR